MQSETMDGVIRIFAFFSQTCQITSSTVSDRRVHLVYFWWVSLHGLNSLFNCDKKEKNKWI